MLAKLKIPIITKSTIKKKAVEMAAVLNMSIGSPVLITENPGIYYPNPFNSVSYNLQPNYESSIDIFKSGIVSITSSVKVVFLLKCYSC